MAKANQELSVLQPVWQSKRYSQCIFRRGGVPAICLLAKNPRVSLEGRGRARKHSMDILEMCFHGPLKGRNGSHALPRSVIGR